MSELILPRRKLLTGIGALLVSSLAAPAIVRAASLMPVRALPADGVSVTGWRTLHGLDEYGDPLPPEVIWISYTINYEAVSGKITATPATDADADVRAALKLENSVEWTYAR